MNLRATRRTELQELFPDHVVNSWMGHSSRVAEKHYLQVTPDHWSKAIGGNAGGNIRDDELAQLVGWAKLYGRADRLCRKLAKRSE